MRKRLIVVFVLAGLTFGCNKPASNVGKSVFESPSAGFVEQDPDKASPIGTCSPTPTKSAVAAMQGIPSLPDPHFWIEGSENTGKVAVNTKIKSMQAYVSETWPKEGWVEESGEAEPGVEFEARLRKGDTIISVKARADLCDKGWTSILFAKGQLADKD